MIKVFRGLNRAYFLVAGVLGTLLAIVLVFSGVNPLVALVIVSAWIFGAAYIFSKMANDKMAAIVSLRDQCQTDAFISEWEKLLGGQKPGSQGDAIARLNLGAGYLTKGDARKALDIMGKVKPEALKSNPLNKGIAAIYHSNFCLAFIRIFDIPMARKALDAFRSVVNDSQFPERERDRILPFVGLRQSQIDIVTGNEAAIDRAEKDFQKYFASSSAPLDKTSAAYWLARIYYMKGNREEETRYLNYAFAHGGDTGYCAEAGRILEQYKNEALGETIPDEDI